MQPFSTDDIVIIKNIDDEAFEFEMFGEPGYVVEAGATERMPGYMARHAMKHLIDKILQKRGDTLQMNNPLMRQELYEQVFQSVEKVIKPMPRNDAQRAKDEYEKTRKTEPGLTVATEGIEDTLADNLINDLETGSAPTDQTATETPAFADAE